MRFTGFISIIFYLCSVVNALALDTTETEWSAIKYYLSLRDEDADTSHAVKKIANQCNGNTAQTCLIYQAEQLFNEMPEAYRLNNAAISLARVGQFDAAERVAAGIKKQERLSTLGHIAVAYVEAYQLDDALRILAQVDDTLHKDRFLSDVIRAVFSQKYDHENQSRVLRLLSEISDQYTRELTLKNVAVLEAQSGRITEAKELLASIKDYPLLKYEALSGFVQLFAKDGDFLQAEQLASTINSEVFQNQAWVSVIYYLANAGQVAEATRIASKINDDVLQISGYSCIAIYQAQANDLEAANILWSQIGDIAMGLDKRDRAWALSTIDMARVHAGYFLDGDELIIELARILSLIASDYQKSAVVRNMAIARANAGQFAQAEQMINELDQGDDLYSALNALVKSLITSKRFSEAERVADIIHDDYLRAQLYKKIGVALSYNEQFTKALNFLEKIDNIYTRGILLTTIANEQINANQLLMAENTTMLIDDLRMRIFAMLDIVETNITKGNRVEADRLLLLLDNMSSQAENDLQASLILLDIARSRADMGQFTNAANIAARIKEKELRANALISIALRL